MSPNSVTVRIAGIMSCERLARMRKLALPIVVLCALLVAGLPAAASSSTPFGGLFQTTIKGKSAQLNGKWLLSFAPNGAYAVAKEPSTHLLIGGSATISGHTLVFVDKTGPLHCTGTQARASYTWSLSGTTLRLAAVKETCSGRAAVLGSAAFVKLK
jgi:hypothetical protein